MVLLKTCETCIIFFFPYVLSSLIIVTLTFSTAAVEWKEGPTVWINVMHRTGQVGTLKSCYCFLKADCSDSLAKFCPSRGWLLSGVLGGWLHHCWNFSAEKVPWVLVRNVSCGWVIRDDLYSVLVKSLVCWVASGKSLPLLPSSVTGEQGWGFWFPLRCKAKYTHFSQWALPLQEKTCPGTLDLLVKTATESFRCYLFYLFVLQTLKVSFNSD